MGDIFKAIEARDLEGVKAAIANKNAKSKYGNKSPLSIAIEVYSGIEYFMEEDDIPEEQLHTEQAKAMDIIEYLIDQGVDPNAGPMQVLPLVIAVNDNLLDVVRLLLEHGANPNPPFTTRYNPINPEETPLFLAIKNTNVEIVHMLLKSNADPNRGNNNSTCLHIAVLKKCMECIHLLVSSGAEIDLPDGNGHTPLVVAMTDSNYEVADVLLELGANIKGILHKILEHERKRPTAESIRYCAEHGADIHAVDTNKNTPLHIACKSGNVEAVRMLLELGADPSLVNSDGKTPVQLSKKPGILALFSIKWKGFRKRDAEHLQLLFSEVRNPRGLQFGNHENKPVEESIFSHCPICLKYVSHEGLTCMYMSHNCTESGGFYHSELWEAFKHKKNNMGYLTGKDVVTWCTLCGRICHDHQHFQLAKWNESHRLIPPPPEGSLPYESDCRGTNGGGGWPEKAARHQGLLDCALELNKRVGEITETEALETLVQEMWNAPLTIGANKVQSITTSKAFQTSMNNFPNLPDAGNISSGAIKVQETNSNIVIGSNTFQKRNGVLYSEETMAPPVYQNFYKRYTKWKKDCNKDIPYPGTPDLLPLVHEREPEGFVDPTGTNSEVVKDVVQFRHKRADGTVNNHDHPETDMIEREFLMQTIQASLSSGEKLGACWLQSCTAKMYPQELLHVIEASHYEDQPHVPEQTREVGHGATKRIYKIPGIPFRAAAEFKADDMAIYERYKEMFNQTFCKAQLGGRTRRKKRY
jgi:ankyrin repeat protein